MSDIVEKLIDLSVEKKLHIADFQLLEKSPTLYKDLNKLCKVFLTRKDIVNLINMVYSLVPDIDNSFSKILSNDMLEEMIDFCYNSCSDYEFGSLVLFSGLRLNPHEHDENLDTLELDDSMIRHIISKYSSQTLLERYEEILKDSYPHIRPFTTCS